MNTEELTQREVIVLNSLVHGFITTAEPVGSRFLADHYDLKISPATIRNVMADLEEKGYIWQPHTSAGRMPTTCGYRTYVDNLNPKAVLDDIERHLIVEQLKKFSQDVDTVISKSAQVISEISSQLGVILSPRFTQGKLDKIELVPISEQRFLVVLSVQSGLIKTVIVEMESEIDSENLHEISQVLNERLYDRPIGQLAEFFDKCFTDIDAQTQLLISAIKHKTHSLLTEGGVDDVHFSGARNVVNHPEFDSQEKMGKMLELLDRKDILVRVMSDLASPGVSIVIGEESKEELMQNCSLITTSFNLNGAVGTLGVIGPTRMQYAKMISLVKFMADTLGYLISKSQ